MNDETKEEIHYLFRYPLPSFASHCGI